MAGSTIGFGGTVDEVGAALTWAPATYWVEDAGHWAPSVVSIADRTIAVAAGVGHARTLRRSEDAAVNKQFDSQPTGSRWDLLVMRHTYNPPGGTSALAVVKGSASGTSEQQQVAVINARNVLVNLDSRVDDHPIALVQITAGQQNPTAVIDLRTWYSDGGLVARSELALQFLTRVGTHVTIGPDQWVRSFSAAGQPVWVRHRIPQVVRRDAAGNVMPANATPLDVDFVVQDNAGAGGLFVNRTTFPQPFATAPIVQVTPVAGTAGAIVVNSGDVTAASMQLVCPSSPNTAGIRYHVSARGWTV